MHCVACNSSALFCPSVISPQVLKALGKGSYGTVYKVQRLADGEVYAMKETDLGRMGPKERADAVNEIRVLGSMGHPNVVRHHETFLAGARLQLNCCCQ
jgi:NIMA (never in mitosis gene a)-related kinase